MLFLDVSFLENTDIRQFPQPFDFIFSINELYLYIMEFFP